MPVSCINSIGDKSKESNPATEVTTAIKIGGKKALNELQQKLDSREVAEMVGKAHNDLMKDIRRYCEQLSLGKIPQSDFSQNQLM